MIPFILAAIGGYLIGDSMKDSQTFADGGITDNDAQNLIEYLETFQTKDAEKIKSKYDEIDKNEGNYGTRPAVDVKIFDFEYKGKKYNALKYEIYSYTNFIHKYGKMPSVFNITLRKDNKDIAEFVFTSDNWEKVYNKLKLKSKQTFADGGGVNYLSPGEVRKFSKKGKWKYILINVKRKNDFQKWSNKKETLEKEIELFKKNNPELASEFKIFETDVNEKIREGLNSKGDKVVQRYDESYSSFVLKPSYEVGGYLGKLDLNKVSNVVIEGIDYDDYPDFSDAYISEADYDGIPMTEEQLEELNENSEFVHESVFEQIN
jgi:hypothetical protein